MPSRSDKDLRVDSLQSFRNSSGSLAKLTAMRRASSLVRRLLTARRDRLPGLFAKLEAWRARFIKEYPIADVELPLAHYLDDDRVLRHVADALRAIRIEDVGPN
jgi:hypothetical protein